MLYLRSFSSSLLKPFCIQVETYVVNLWILECKVFAILYLRSLYYGLPLIQYSQYIWWRGFIILLQLKNWNAHSLGNETFKELLVAFVLLPQTVHCGFGHINVSGHFNFEDMDKRRLFGMAYAILMTMALTKLSRLVHLFPLIFGALNFLLWSRSFNYDLQASQT